jgi:hypothetical protein
MHKVKGNTLVTTTVREIATRRAVIVDNGDGTFHYTVYHNGVAYLNSTRCVDYRIWPYEFQNLRDYIETTQFFGSQIIGWQKNGYIWRSDEHLCDSGGKPFTAEELDVIRRSRRPKKSAARRTIPGTGSALEGQGVNLP